MSNFDCDKLTSLVEFISKEYVPKYYPGFSISIYENNKESYYFNSKYLDKEQSKPFSKDSIFRIFSMTKPIVSTAAMQLFETGKFNLDDPVKKFIPEWNNLEVYESGSKGDFKTKVANRDMLMLDLFTHTSGLTYGLQEQTPVDEEYGRSGIENVVDSRGINGTLSADEIINLLSDIPLEFSPGSHYNYSLSIDILGFIIERISNISLKDYLMKNIFVPLGMIDTSFYLDIEKKERFAPCYRWSIEKDSYEGLNENKNSKIKDIDFFNEPNCFSGGGGLLSTISDYQKFGSELLNSKSGKSNLLISKDTADLMMRNHLPNNLDMTELSKFKLSGEEYYKGVGYGLGGSIVIDSSLNLNNSFDGDFGWGGAANTSFYISPFNEFSVVFMTQVLESEETRRLNKDIRTIIKESLIN